jgi:hypothetical protein
MITIIAAQMLIAPYQLVVRMMKTASVVNARRDHLRSLVPAIVLYCAKEIASIQKLTKNSVVPMQTVPNTRHVQTARAALEVFVYQHLHPHARPMRLQDVVMNALIPILMMIIAVL